MLVLCGDCRGLPGCNSLAFASPKESKQSSHSGGSLTSLSEVMGTPKGDPQSGPLCGSLKKLKVPENLETCLLRRLRTSKFFIRHFQLFQAQPGRGGGLNSGPDQFPICLPLPWERAGVRAPRTRIRTRIRIRTRTRTRIFSPTRTGYAQERRRRRIKIFRCWRSARPTSF